MLLPPMQACATIFMFSPMIWMFFCVCTASSLVGERMSACGLQ